jgi:DNA-binding NarL/FixJ family response regulator
MYVRSRLVIVDDIPLFHEGVEAVVKRAPDFEIVASGATAADACELAERYQPDLLLVSHKAPDAICDITKEITKVSPNTRVVILSVSERQEDVYSALAAGVRCYLLIHVEPDELMDSLRATLSGEILVDEVLAARLLREAATTITPAPATPIQALVSRQIAFQELDTREQFILKQISLGKTNAEIAASFSVSTRTIKNWLGIVFKKLHVRNRTEALYAVQMFIALI